MILVFVIVRSTLSAEDLDLVRRDAHRIVNNRGDVDRYLCSSQMLDANFEPMNTHKWRSLWYISYEHSLNVEGFQRKELDYGVHFVGFFFVMFRVVFVLYNAAYTVQRELQADSVNG